MKQYTQDEKRMLSKVNEIAMQIGVVPDAEDFIFAFLSPYLEQFMGLLKQLKPLEMEALFIEYEGIMKLMRLMEDSAQQLERELGLA